jgi:beta-lactamase class A
MIPPGGRTYRNLASAHDYSRFLYALWYDQLPYATEVKTLMALPNRDRINSDVPEIPASTKVYDKTGTTARLCGNMGIVEARGRDGKSYPYIFVAIIEKSARARQYSRWIKSRGDVVREVSAMTYAYMKSRYPLA